MIDKYDHQFEGTGYELHGETRVKPAPGHHYYAKSLTRAELLARQLQMRHGGGALSIAENDDVAADEYSPP